MTTITDIYTKYRIFQGLQMHQLRVAAVARIIAQEKGQTVDIRSCVLAGLLHDMGNIVKSNLERFPELLEPEGGEYWQSVKDDVIVRFGRGEHEATRAMLEDIGASEKVISIVDNLAFNEIPTLRDTGSIEAKICEYADLRVAPHGVVSLHQRLEDGRKRYAHVVAQRTDEHTNLIYAAIEDIERELFEGIPLAPDDITDVSVAPIIEELRGFEV